MVVLDFLSNIDIYGPHAKFYINNKSKFSSYLSIILSIITYIIFSLVLYFQMEDHIFKTNPIISLIKEDARRHHVPFNFTNDFLKSYFTGRHLFRYNQKFFSHLNIKANLEIYFWYKGNLTTAFRKIETNICSEGEVNYFKSLPGFVNNDNNPFLCTKGKDLETLNDFLYDYFEVVFNIDFGLCSPEDTNCIYDEKFNNILRFDDAFVDFHFLASAPDLTNFTNPLFNYINSVLMINRQSMVSDLSMLQVKTKDGGLFDSGLRETNFKIKDSYNTNRRGTWVDFRIHYTNHNVIVYERHYRSFSSALASTLSITKLFLFCFKLVTKYYSKYKVQCLLINGSFDYQNSIGPSTHNTMESINASSSKMSIMSERFVGCSRPRREFSFNFFNRVKLNFKNMCKGKKTKSELFYKVTTKNISRNLSIDTLLKFIYDLHKLEHVVLNAEEYKKIKEYKRIIDLEDPDVLKICHSEDRLSLEDVKLIRIAKNEI
jgi:hypothetical protein